MIWFCSSDLRQANCLASLGAARKRRNQTAISDTISSDSYNLMKSVSDFIRQFSRAAI